MPCSAILTVILFVRLLAWFVVEAAIGAKYRMKREVFMRIWEVSKRSMSFNNGTGKRSEGWRKEERVQSLADVEDRD